VKTYWGPKVWLNEFKPQYSQKKDKLKWERLYFTKIMYKMKDLCSMNSPSTPPHKSTKTNIPMGNPSRQKI
jgi:hypothetical protein